MATKNPDMYNGEYVGVVTAVEKILWNVPELISCPRHLTTIKGILQFSKVLAYGLSLWDKGERFDYLLWQQIKAKDPLSRVASFMEAVGVQSDDTTAIWTWSVYSSPDDECRDMRVFLIN